MVIAPADPSSRIATLEARNAVLVRENAVLLEKIYALSEALEDSAAQADPHALAGAPDSLPEPLRRFAGTASPSSGETDTLARRVKALEEDKHSLLQQYQQVQEELQRMHAAHLASREQSDRRAGLIQALYARNPLLVGWIKADLQHHPARATATFKHAAVAGQELASLTVAAVRDSAISATLKIQGEGLRQSPLLIDAAGTVMHSNGSPVFLTRAERRVLRSIPVALQTLLEQHDVPDRLAWSTALEGMFRGLAAQRDTWSFSRIDLRRVHANPDYEHLWFELTDARLGDRTWPTFQFRMAAANVRREGFSQHPKLEFPLQAPHPHQFEKWFDESEDEFGPKYELRFDLRRRTLDAAVWSELSPGDQQVMAALLAEMPDWIESLYPAHPAARRPAADWLRLAWSVGDLLTFHQRAVSVTGLTGSSLN